MREIQHISINISGCTQTGKTAVAHSIKKMLAELGYAVVVMDAAERFNPSDPIESSEPHEKPDKSKTVFTIQETNYPRQEPV